MQFGEEIQPLLSQMTGTLFSQLYADVSTHKLGPLSQIEMNTT